MRIQYLYIKHYHVLHNLEFFFGKNESVLEETTYGLDLIVGVNGTGKSTLLRFLAELFQYLSSSYRLPPFEFRIRYQLQRSQDESVNVTISNLDEDKQPFLEEGKNIRQEKRLFISIDEQGKATKKGLYVNVASRYLPNQIIAFTSGSENGWKREWMDQQHIYYELPPTDTNDPQFESKLRFWNQREEQSPSRTPATPAEEERQTRTANVQRFLLVRQRHLPLVILCGFLVEMSLDISSDEKDSTNPRKKVLGKALEEARIKRCNGFSLTFSFQPDKTYIDDRMFIQEVTDLAAHRVQLSPERRLLVFDLSHDEIEKRTEQVQKLLDVQGNGLQLFQRLAELAQEQDGQSALLEDVHLFLERAVPQNTAENEQPPLHLLEWLSDGEISFLGRLCLLSLLRNTEALVLLDEPEVHFNDYWKRQLVHLLDQCLQNNYSHVFMTTHSSITLSDVYNTNISVLQRNGTYTEHVTTPSLRTLGTDPSDIIVGIFQAESATGAQSVAYLQEKIKRLLALNDTEKKRQGLKELLNSVGPSVWRFLIRRELYALEDVQQYVPLERGQNEQ